MTALPLEPHTEAEEATLKRIEGAEPAPESHEVVERVAQAIWDVDQDPDEAWPVEWDDDAETERERYRSYALAAVSALSSAREREAALAPVLAAREIRAATPARFRDQLAQTCAACGHPTQHHDGGSCWTDRNGNEVWDREACPCLGFEERR